jgi:type II secretory pathway pseudopilin PulG
MLRKGFTIIEVLIMVMVFVLISGAVIANFSSARGSARLRAAAQELAANIKRAQAYAYANTTQSVCTDNLICGSGSACDALAPAGCTATPILSYGVVLDANSDGKAYVIYADADNSGSYRAGEAIPYGMVALPLGITFQSVANNSLLYSYSQANSAPFVSCSGGGCTTTAVLYDANTKAVKTVSISKQTGTVSIY